MKRYLFSQHDGVNFVAPVLTLPANESSEKSSDDVFKLVYMPDPLTGHPRSDLGTYMSDNTNPLVRDFIERQLRTDFSQQAGVTPDGISDYDISYLTRDVHETESVYLNRVSKYLSGQKAIYKKAVSDIAAKKVEPVEPKDN